jgi:hypothetical protein
MQELTTFLSKVAKKHLPFLQPQEALQQLEPICLETPPATGLRCEKAGCEPEALKIHHLRHCQKLLVD